MSNSDIKGLLNTIICDLEGHKWVVDFELGCDDSTRFRFLCSRCGEVYTDRLYDWRHRLFRRLMNRLLKRR